MIISRTPLRISFAGGGTDLAAFYELEGGAVISTAINKYIFATVNCKFDDHIRVSYSRTEIVEKVADLQHELVREAMKLTGVDRGIEITTIADIPSSGTGLGSSSTFTVGLLNALHAYKGENVSAEALAREACRIEIEIVGEPIGKQDQYISAYGGLQFIEFNRDGSVFINPVIVDRDQKQALEGNLLLFYTGITRRANSILAKQKENSASKLKELKSLKQLAYDLRDTLQKKGPVDDFGRALNEGWKIKKSLAEGISNPEIDGLYEKAMRAGALGGKILGAGGGGFLLLYVPEAAQKKVREALSSFRETKFNLEPQGSKIIYVSD
ncbi:MAG TPA: GHMP kinase [Candidatus Omnitrophota bacterium]|nr:GHMP kinase [Candidatus Omnitrophota bacterium]